MSIFLLKSFSYTVLPRRFGGVITRRDVNTPTLVEGATSCFFTAE